MSGAHDVVIVGAGHNGLTAACFLARAGRRVLVLERRETPGGCAGGEEFHPGFRSPGLFHDSLGVRRWVVDELGLARYGLRVRAHRPEILVVGHDGSRLTLAATADDAAREAERAHPGDGERYLEFREFLERVGGVIRDQCDGLPIDLVSPEATPTMTLLRRAARLRRLGRTRMAELLRIPPMSVADLLDEWFGGELLKGALALPAVAATFSGPRSPGSAANLLLREAVAGPGVHGGGPALVGALVACAKAAGAEIRTSAGVREIVCTADGVTGVRLDDGELVPTSMVAASCDPKHLFLELLPPASVPDRLEREIRVLRSRGTTAQVLLAVEGRPEDPGARPPELAWLCGSMEQLERAHDAVKYRRVSERPALEILAPPAEDGLAPEGCRVVSVLVHFAPRDSAAGWDDPARDRLADHVLGALRPVWNAIGGRVVARRVVCPATLESTMGLTGGHPHHLEHALDQLLVRPAPGCVSYRTPIAGLFLCGSGSHPGGGLTCAPGALAARTILAS